MRKLPLQVLDEGGDVEGLHVGGLADAATVVVGRAAARGQRERMISVVVGFTWRADTEL